MYDYANWKNSRKKSFRKLPLSTLVNDFFTDDSQKLSLWVVDEISKKSLSKLALAINTSGSTGKLHPKHFLVFDMNNFDKKVVNYTKIEAKSLLIDMRERHLHTVEISFIEYKKIVKAMLKNLPESNKVDDFYVSIEDMVQCYKSEMSNNPNNLDLNNPVYFSIIKTLNKHL